MIGVESFFNKLRKRLLGSKDRKGIIPTVVTYIVLLSLGYVYILPVLKMFVISFMSQQDQVDPKVLWLPTQMVLTNFKIALDALKYWDGLYITAMFSVVPALLQTVSTAITGYAFARFDFPLKKFWIVLVVAFYVLPLQLLLVPKYLMFLNYNLVGKVWALYLPAILGQGLKSGIFILIFYQFFHSYPKSLDEAAEIDGAGRIKVFYRIALPMSGPALVISIIFSVVWYWNETSAATMYFARGGYNKLFGVTVSNFWTLPMRLLGFDDMIKEYFELQGGVQPMTDGYSFAGSLLVILPMLIMFLILQKQFVESVERSGITGE